MYDFRFPLGYVCIANRFIVQMLTLTTHPYYRTNKINTERLLAQESEFSPIFLTNSEFLKKTTHAYFKVSFKIL